MKPTNFKEANIKYAENQKEYNTLPALKLDGDKGEVISCWKLNIFERLQVLFYGRIWLNLLTFNKPLTPSYLSAFRFNVYSKETDSKILTKIAELLTKN